VTTAFDELQFHLRSLSRCIYYVTDEEDRFLLSLRRTLHADHTLVYNPTMGLVPLVQLVDDWSSRAHPENAASAQIHGALMAIYRDAPQGDRRFYVIMDPERWLTDAHVVRRVLNILHQATVSKQAKILIFVGARRVPIPEKLSPYMEVIADTGLSEDETVKAVGAACGAFGEPPVENAASVFKGLNSYQVAMSISQSRKARDGAIDPVYIAEYRKRQLRKTDLVQYLDVGDVSFDQVGGLGRLKKWAAKIAPTWTQKGRDYGLKAPRGVLFTGVWGAGKSLGVKAMASTWGVPLVGLEIGRLRSSGVGDSEGNVYKAIRIIESVAPCVTGETLVTLASGISKPIADIWRHCQAGDKLPRVRCWDEDKLKVSTTNVQAVTRRRAVAFRVEAASGFSLNATADHRHYVMRGGLPEWVRTGDLVRGDMLAVPLAVHTGDAGCSSFLPSGMRIYRRPDGGPEFRRGGGGWKDAVAYRFPDKWTPLLGWLLGALEGDGYIGKRNTIGFVNTSRVLLRQFEFAVWNLFGLTAVRHRLKKKPNYLVRDVSRAKPCWDSKVSNQLVAEFLGAARSGLLASPADARAAFLAGWVDADGCLGPGKMTLCVSDPVMFAERELLARQITQSLGVMPSKFGKKDMEITGPRAAVLAAVVAPHLVGIKKKKARCVSSSKIGFDRDAGFACADLLAAARKKSAVKFKNLGISSGVTWSYENGKVPVSERHMRNYVARFGRAGEPLRRLLEAECRWVRVKHIKSIGPKVVYDLVCSGRNTHSFIANGLITHNCVVFADEAEKSFSGSQSSGASDAGTLSRQVGILSTWLQETRSPICFAMTTNHVKTLPAELVNRASERFFFDVPGREDREEILRIHLKLNGQKPENYDLSMLAGEADGMVGREIAQVIEAAMVESFIHDKPCLDEALLVEQIVSKPRILKTMADEMAEIIDWVGWSDEADDGVRARYASEPQRGLRLLAGARKS
jgi:AAA+ superfamily predicted ATPase